MNQNSETNATLPDNRDGQVKGDANRDDQVDGTTKRDDDDDDVECGSSDIGSELVVQSFADIRSFSVVRKVEVNDYIDLSNACFLPNGDIVLCSEKGITILDMKMDVKVQIYPQNNYSEPKHTAIVDNRTFVVSIPTRKYLQLVSVTPSVKIGRGIPLNCFCEGLACYKKHFYVYTRSLEETSCFVFSGIQVLSPVGRLLKRIDMFDYISCFDISRDGNVLYYGHKPWNIEKKVFKCVKSDGDIVFEIPEKEAPNALTVDEDGCTITFEQTPGKITVRKSKGVHSVWLPMEKTGVIEAFSMRYNKYTNTCIASVKRRHVKDRTRLTPSHEYQESKLIVYQAQF